MKVTELKEMIENSKAMVVLTVDDSDKTTLIAKGETMDILQTITNGFLKIHAELGFTNELFAELLEELAETYKGVSENDSKDCL